MNNKVPEGLRFHNTNRGVIQIPREKSDHARSYTEIQALKNKRNKWLRRALVAGVTAIALSKTPIPGAAADFLRGIGEDTDKPVATEANMGGKSIINLKEVTLETGNKVIWPILRENPTIHTGKDGINPNGIPWTDVATINKTPIDVKPGEEITITVNNPTFVMGGNPDNAIPGAPKGLWEVLEVVRKDGTREIDYLSVSGNTQGFVDLKLSGLMTPLDQQNGNTIEDKVNITKITTNP